MKRIVMAERPGWQEQADALGFRFHSLDGVRYWDESVHYRFSLAEIENDIELPSEGSCMSCCMGFWSIAQFDVVFDLGEREAVVDRLVPVAHAIERVESKAKRIRLLLPARSFGHDDTFHAMRAAAQPPQLARAAELYPNPPRESVSATP